MNDTTHQFDPTRANQLPTEAAAPPIADRESEENRQIIAAYLRDR